jgi:ABC-type Mn2+/Zn2+ transport system permease subunit
VPDIYLPPEVPTARSARELIAFYFGAQIRARPIETAVVVGLTAVPVGTYANTRSAITFGNCGSNLIVVGFSSGVTAAAGYPVPIGGFISFTWFLDNELVMRDFFAISGTAAQTLYVVETVLSLA